VIAVPLVKLSKKKKKIQKTPFHPLLNKMKKKISITTIAAATTIINLLGNFIKKKFIKF
jgi:hypothetical protein